MYCFGPNRLSFNWDNMGGVPGLRHKPCYPARPIAYPPLGAFNGRKQLRRLWQAMSLAFSRICSELDPSRPKRGAVRKRQAGIHLAALTTFVLGCISLPFAATAQPQTVDAQVAGSPLTATQVSWENLPSPAARLAKQVAGRQMNLPPNEVPGIQAALYDLNDGQQLLLIQGGGFSGASATGVGIFLSGAHGFREAGAVYGSRSDSIPITLVPVRGGYPRLRVGVTQPFPYNPNLSMAEQRYRVISHLLQYNSATGQYVDTGAGTR